MPRRFVSLSLIAVICALVALIGVLTVQRAVEVSAPPPVVLSDDDRADAEHLIRARINSLSPVPPMLGGKFDVSSIEWDARGRAAVTYGDGESTFEAVADVQTGSGRVKVSGFAVKE